MAGTGSGAWPYPLTVFYDGECPLCRREIALFRRLDRKRRLHLVDFSHPEFDEAQAGLDRARLSAVIHARWADGTIITEVEVFRALWTAVGLRALARLSRLAGIDGLLRRGYAWFARHRLRLTGRADQTPQDRARQRAGCLGCRTGSHGAVET